MSSRTNWSTNKSQKGDSVKEKLIDKIRPLWGKMSYAEIAEKLFTTAESVRKTGRKHGLEPYRWNAQNRQLTPTQEVERDATVTALGRKVKMSTSKNQVLQEQLAIVRNQLEAFKIVGDSNSYTIAVPKKKEITSATAVAVASDWHIAENVHADHVNGLNEFNLDIAQQRADKFFQNVVKLVKLFKQSSDIDTLVLALLGDFINGQLREEAMENNEMQPAEELLKAREMIRAGIKYILSNTDVKLIVPCHSGNHARMTKKLHWSTEAENSLEYVLYHVLAGDFADNNRVKFIIPKSYHSYLDIAGFTVRFHHGHSIKYGGGIGGLFIPAYKSVSQWQKGRHADLDVFGHFHQTKDGGNFLCNGSLIGFNEFAVAIKADYEKPKQTFFLVDHKRKEKTVTTPIFLE